MKAYYICALSHLLSVHHNLNSAHYIDLENGLILLCADFPNEHIEDKLLSQPGVSALPHPLSGETIENHPHKALLQKHLPGLPDTATSFQIGQYARKRMPSMGSRH